MESVDSGPVVQGPVAQGPVVQSDAVEGGSSGTPAVSNELAADLALAGELEADLAALEAELAALEGDPTVAAQAAEPRSPGSPEW